MKIKLSQKSTGAVDKTTHQRIPQRPGIISMGFLYILAFIPVSTSLIIILIEQYNRSTVTIAVSVYSMAVFILLFKLLEPHTMLLFPGLFFFAAGNAFWFAVPALTQVMTPDLWFGDWIYRVISDQLLIQTCFGVSVFFMSGIVTFSFFINHSGFRHFKHDYFNFSPRVNYYLSSSARKKVLFFGFIIGFSPYLIFGGNLNRIISGIMSSRTSKAWSLSPEDSLAYASGIKQMFFWITGSFLVTVLSLSLLYFILDNKNFKRRLVFFFFSILSFLIIYFDRGTRSLFVVSLLPAIFLGLLYQNHMLLNRKKIILSGLIIALILTALTQFQMFYRMDYSRKNIEEIEINNFFSLKEQNDFFTETAVAIEMRQRMGYNLHEVPLFFFVANVIPRSLWPEKPLPQTLWHYSLDRRKTDIWLKGGNALPSVVGQYYINWGWSGIVWGGFSFGLLSYVATILIWKTNYKIEFALLGTMLSAFLFASFRFFAPGFHYPILALAVLLCLGKNIDSILNRIVWKSTQQT